MSCPAILFIVFNRPKHASKVFEAIRQAKPERLYIAVDGARSGRQDDVANITATMKIFETIDWDCSVKKLARTENLGCKMAVSSAITWFFGQEEKGIILEDDCLPSPSFFSYCHHLLEKYETNESIMHISGVNVQEGKMRGDASYYYSKVCHIWGWASWRRAWEKYDINMTGLESFFDFNLHRSIIRYEGSNDYWKKALVATKNGLIDTWDYQWVFSIWKNNGLCITPNHNLVSNIGFDETATHTKAVDDRVSNKPYVILSEKVKDSDLLVVDTDADRFSFKKLFVPYNTFPKRTARKIKKYINKGLRVKG